MIINSNVKSYEVNIKFTLNYRIFKSGEYTDSGIFKLWKIKIT